MRKKHVLAFAVVAALGRAQTAVDAARYTTAESGLSSDFHGMAGGNLIGHGVPDAVFVAGTEPILCSGLTLHAAVQRLPNTAGLAVNDVATVPGGGRDGRDAVAMVTDVGLRMWVYDVATPHFLVQTLGGPQWNGATRVRCGDVDGDGVDDIVGLLASGTKLRVFARGPGASHYAIELGEPVFAFEVLQWDGSGAAEIAVLTASGLRVLTGAGGASTTVASATMTGGCLARAPGTAGSDLLAWSTTDLVGTPQLHLVGNGFASPALALASAPTALAAGDVDGDGLADVLATVANAPDPLVCGQEGGQLVTRTAIVFDDIAVTANRAMALVGDCDHDGDADIAMPLPGSKGIGLHRGTQVQEDPPELLPGFAYLPNTEHDDYRFSLTWSSASLPANTDGCEVRVWGLEAEAGVLYLGQPVTRLLLDINEQDFELTIAREVFEVTTTAKAAAIAMALVERASGVVVRRHPFQSFVISIHAQDEAPTFASAVVGSAVSWDGHFLPPTPPGTYPGGLPVGGSGKGPLPPPPPPPADPPPPGGE